MRTAVALIAAASLALSLAACSSSPTGGDENTAASKCETTAPGTVSDAVKVSGDFGAEPKVTVDKSLKLTKTERTVVIKGKGAVAQEGAEITVDYQLINARTGDVINATNYAEGEQSKLVDRKSTRLNSSHGLLSRMPSSA